MKTLILILLLGSCSLASKIERSNYVFWESCKAIKVESIKEKKHSNIYHCSHPLTDFNYRLELSKKDTIFEVGDTIVLQGNYKSKVWF